MTIIMGTKQASALPCRIEVWWSPWGSLRFIEVAVSKTTIVRSLALQLCQGGLMKLWKKLGIFLVVVGF